MKEFNTTAVCIPSKHYMVDITEHVSEMRKLVDAGKYVAIKRGRQYGKTTTLRALQRALQDDYVVISLSFEGLTQAGFQSEGEFVQAFSRMLLDRHEFFGLAIPEATLRTLARFVAAKPKRVKMDELYRMFRRWIVASDKPLVMLIDEVDSASNNQVFIDFLGLLRDGYISRESDGVPAFHSVILAGSTDIRHLKRKISPDDGRRQNSPWNIAMSFTANMSFGVADIKKMLDEYEADHHTGMDTALLARLIRGYTNGHPFLVSRICQLIDEEVSATEGPRKAWTRRGVEESVKMILAEDNALFQSITKNLNNFSELKDAMHSILMEDAKPAFNPNQDDIAQMQMLGLIKNEHGKARISNWVFETLLYNLYLSDDELQKTASEHKVIPAQETAS